MAWKPLQVGVVLAADAQASALSDADGDGALGKGRVFGTSQLFEDGRLFAHPAVPMNGGQQSNPFELDATEPREKSINTGIIELGLVR